jgi:hypothetical protein
MNGVFTQSVARRVAAHPVLDVVVACPEPSRQHPVHFLENGGSRFVDVKSPPPFWFRITIKERFLLSDPFNSPWSVTYKFDVPTYGNWGK